MHDLDRHIEAIIFSSDHPVPVADLVASLNRALELELDTHVVLNHLEALLVKYDEDFFPFRIVKTGGGYRFLTKEEYHPSVSTFLNIKSKRRLSTAAMETLAIIAYRQPISKTEIENIRGVNCDYSIQKLLERELIIISGRADSPGKPLLYSTAPAFMDYFGINSVDELPKLREFEEGGDSIGVPAEMLDEHIPSPELEREDQPGEEPAEEASISAEHDSEEEPELEEKSGFEDEPAEDELAAEEPAPEEEPEEELFVDEEPEEEDPLPDGAQAEDEQSDETQAEDEQPEEEPRESPST